MELIQTPPRQIVRFLSLSLTDSEVIADYGPNVAVVSEVTSGCLLTHLSNDIFDAGRPASYLGKACLCKSQVSPPVSSCITPSSLFASSVVGCQSVSAR